MPRMDPNKNNEAVQEFQPKRRAETTTATDAPLSMDNDVIPEQAALEDDQQQNDDDDEDDDEFEIVIDGGSGGGQGEEKRGLTSVSLGGQGQSGQGNGNQQQQQQQQQNPIDLNAVPLYPGTNTSMLDADLEEAFPGVDKPWRRPGADMTDYFNFGFNEFTWRQYCTKQKVLREEFGSATRKIMMDRPAQPVPPMPMPVMMPAVPPPPHQMPMPPPHTHSVSNSNYHNQPQPGYPPQYADRYGEQRGRERSDRPRRSRSREPAYGDHRGGHDVRDVRDTRDTRDGREVRDVRDTRDARDGRDTRDTRDRDYHNRRPGRR